MLSSLVLIVLLISLGSANTGVNILQEKCLVCRTFIDEFLDQVSQIDPNKKITVGQYRLDQDGNTGQKLIPLTKSESHLIKVLEKTCSTKMDDYVKATYKSNNQLTLFKLVINGTMNPLMDEVDIIQDGDLNKSVKIFCEEIIGLHDEYIVEKVILESKNIKSEICSTLAGYCEHFEEEEEEEEKDDDYKTEL